MLLAGSKCNIGCVSIQRNGKSIEGQIQLSSWLHFGISATCPNHIPKYIQWLRYGKFLAFLGGSCISACNHLSNFRSKDPKAYRLPFNSRCVFIEIFVCVDHTTRLKIWCLCSHGVMEDVCNKKSKASLHGTLLMNIMVKIYVVWEPSRVCTILFWLEDDYKWETTASLSGAFLINVLFQTFVVQAIST